MSSAEGPAGLWASSQKHLHQPALSEPRSPHLCKLVVTLGGTAEIRDLSCVTHAGTMSLNQGWHTAADSIQTCPIWVPEWYV